MNQLLSLRTIPLAALCCATFVLTAKPAPVTAAQPSKDEYCVNNGSGQSCAATLEQCQAASSGIGGSCFRVPSATCVYREPKPGRSGDEVRQEWGPI